MPLVLSNGVSGVGSSGEEVSFISRACSVTTNRNASAHAQESMHAFRSCLDLPERQIYCLCYGLGSNYISQLHYAKCYCLSAVNPRATPRTVATFPCNPQQVWDIYWAAARQAGQQSTSINWQHRDPDELAADLKVLSAHAGRHESTHALLSRP